MEKKEKLKKLKAARRQILSLQKEANKAFDGAEKHLNTAIRQIKEAIAGATGKTKTSLTGKLKDAERFHAQFIKNRVLVNAAFKKNLQKIEKDIKSVT